MNEYLVQAAYADWPLIQMVYKRFKKKRPVILLDIEEHRIYAYPCTDYMKTLSKRSQKILADQYEEAGQHNRFVVFVRDNVKRKLVSFLMDYDARAARVSEKLAARRWVDVASAINPDCISFTVRPRGLTGRPPQARVKDRRG
jgi:hypothetical protein